MTGSMKLPFMLMVVIKDIMRSFSHELVHHNQNENGQFANIVGQGGSNLHKPIPI